MITLTQAQRALIESEVKKHYPNECCGIIAGQIEGGHKTVSGLYPVRNINKERAFDRYVIDPNDFLRVSKEIDQKGEHIVGIYHSHPDHPDRPSEFDRAHAWEVFSYIIVGVQKGRDVSMRSFTLDEEHQFREEEIRMACE